MEESAYLIHELPQGTEGGFSLRGAMKRLWKSKDQEMMVSGPAECLGGEVRLYDPSTDSHVPIAELCAKKLAPIVQTLNGPVQARVPFIRGRARLYRVSLEDGSSFTATKQHLVLTTTGWTLVEDLCLDDPILGARSDFHPQSDHIYARNVGCERWLPPENGAAEFDALALRPVRVVSVEFEREDEFYDLQVPGEAHYLAEGVWHHNCGKTIGCLVKVNALLWKYPGCQGVIVRKTQSSMQGSVLASYQNKILGDTYKKVIKPYGNNKPEWYDYPNGSRLWVGGMDNPDKVLSSERDFAYVNQAEELELRDWEYLLTRTTGRAGNMPYAQLFGDCNPGPRKHWIMGRFGEQMLYAQHQDNPTLYDANGVITEQGIRSIAALDALTGVRKERLRHGRWVSAEGQVYENFSQANVRRKSEVPRCDRFIEVVDWGFTNPLVWQRWAIDNDGRAYLVMEFYRTQMLVEDAAKLANRLTLGMPAPEVTICDHDAEDRKTWEKYRGLKTTAADKRDVRSGVGDVQGRIRPANDGTPRLIICSDALVGIDKELRDNHRPTCGLDEVESYIWNSSRDVPVKEWDHAMDCWRYLVRYLDANLNKKIVVVRRSSSVSFG